MELIEYKGNRFRIEEVKSWYKSNSEYRAAIESVDCEQVWLPESYNHKPVTEWYMDNSVKSDFSQARVLHIPAAIAEIKIHNDILPELEKVEIDPANQVFATDGRLIIACGENELLYCPVCKGESMEIPDTVRKIAAKAFYGTCYEEIRYPKREISIHKDAFQGSRWLELQDNIVVIGNLLYQFPEGVKFLRVPDSVRRFHPDLFHQCRNLERIETPVLPSSRDIDAIRQICRCRFLAITSDTANINIGWLRKWQTLEKVVMADGHKKYKTADGVLYSRDGRTLVWYPSGKKDSEFTVPEGVRKIGEFAFANQEYLKKVILPKSVCMLGIGAFARCRELEEAELSSDIKEIPDAGFDPRSGVFAECPKLKDIVLPEKLNYLGSFAFYESGLRSVTFHQNLEQMGEYALMARNLHEIALPQSVRRVGKGSLFYVSEAEVYEGTAKGLISAVNAVLPDMKNKSANLEWKRCHITVLHKRSGKKEHFLIPGSLKKGAAYHLDIAWNGEHIDYEEYDQCLEEITDSGEKIEFAEQGILRYRADEDNVYADYIRKVSYKIGHRLLEQGREQEFLSFLKRNFLSENSLQKLLKDSNESGKTVCSAYITEKINQKGRKTGSFRI